MASYDRISEKFPFPDDQAGPSSGSRSESPAFETDFDLRRIARMFGAKRLGSKNPVPQGFDDSGYHSIMARSSCSQYGTGWLMLDSESCDAGSNSSDEWGMLSFQKYFNYEFYNLYEGNFWIQYSL